MAICYTLGSSAARQPSHSAFLWFLTMPPNQARSTICAADPQAAPAQHSVIDCTADKLQMQHCLLRTVLCTGYKTSTTLRNTLGGQIASDRYTTWAPPCTVLHIRWYNAAMRVELPTP